MKKINRFFIFIVVFVVVIVGISITHFFPLLHNTPLPSGHYAVGMSSYHWIDYKRTESRLPSQKREINVEFFYPSNFNDHKEQLFPYHPAKMNALKKIKAKNTVLPYFVWNCLLSGIKSHAEPHAPLNTTESSYPIIIFLPGIAGDNIYNVYLEELASHGYIVAAIDPPFDTSVSVFSDGTIIELDSILKHAIAKMNRDEIYAYRTQAHKIWIADIEFVLNQIKTLNNDRSSLFYNKINLNSIGFMGHSHGGAVVTEYCATHDNCKAGVNLDGWTKTVNTTQGFDTPFMFLVNEKGMDGINELFENMNPATTKKIEIGGAWHAAFSDYILVKKPLLYIVKTFKEAEDVRNEINNYLVSFFDTYLKNKEDAK